jgi:nitrate reductase delta subunit
MAEVYETLAALLEYPNESFPSQMGTGRNVANDFIARVGALTLSELQELYTRTFDLNPVCALEIGYHLFGENYKRGEFLANLRETEAPFDLGQEQQLPDYLPVLLRLLNKLEDEELHASLIGECLIPGTEKMLASIKDSENPYRYLLEAVRTRLRSEPGIQLVVDSSNFTTRANLPVLTMSPIDQTPDLF